MSQPIPLWKHGHIVGYADLREIDEIEDEHLKGLPPPFTHFVVGLKRGRLTRRFYVVTAHDLGQAFPKGWRPA